MKGGALIGIESHQNDRLEQQFVFNNCPFISFLQLRYPEQYADKLQTFFGGVLGDLGRLLDLFLDATWMQLGKILGSGITLLDIFWGGLGPLFRIFSHFFRICGAS